MRCVLLACALFGLVAAGGTLETLTNAHKASIIERHNYYRSNYPKNVDDMHMMSWDSGLASGAAAHAKKCVFSHSSNSERSNIAGFSYVGENLAAGSQGSSKYELPDAPVTYCENWAEERNNYNFNSGSCSGVCGHYTQMVWHSSIRVGCALARCPAGTIFGMASTYLVCRYGPGGNMYGELPAHTANSGPCASHPCGQGHGACLAVSGGYKCECMEGYTSAGGTGPCTQGGSGNSNACTNYDCGHGACYLSGSAPSCNCNAGWAKNSGGKCKVQNDPCSPDPCVHGSCKALQGGNYQCSCDAHWHGDNCNVADDPCSPNPCKNGGTCNKNGAHFTCSCKTGYSGLDCGGSSGNTGSGNAPSTSTFVGALWSLVNSKRTGAGKPAFTWSTTMKNLAQQEAKCPPTSDTTGPTYSATIKLCTSSSNPSASWAGSVVNWWAAQSSGRWITKTGITYAACAVRSSTCRGPCAGGNNYLAIACEYTTANAESMTLIPTRDPMNYGRPEGEAADSFSPEQSHLGIIVTGCAIGVALVAVVVAIVVRRRRTVTPEEYSEMQEC